MGLNFNELTDAEKIVVMCAFEQKQCNASCPYIDECGEEFFNTKIREIADKVDIYDKLYCK